MTQSLERLVAVAMEATQRRTQASVCYTSKPKQNALWLDDVPDAKVIAAMFPFVPPDKGGAKHLFIIVPGTEFSYDATVWLMARRVILYPDGRVLCTRLSIGSHTGYLTSKNLARRTNELKLKVGEAEIDDYVIDL